MRGKQSPVKCRPVPMKAASPALDKNLVCTVCGANATGFNFAVITCMCCKTFFRRNGLIGLKPLHCRYSTQTCTIDLKTRRDCSYCRLKKCYEVGMRKELILTDDMKRIKREKIMANRQMTLSTLHSTRLSAPNVELSHLHSSSLSNIFNAYEEYCRAPIMRYEKHEYESLSQQPIRTRIKIKYYLQYHRNYFTSLVDFFKRIPEFRQLSDDQQIALSSHNILLLIRISVIETMEDQLPIWPSISLLLESIFGKSLLDETDHLLTAFKLQISDSKCIRLLIAILLFSTFNNYRGDVNTIYFYKIQEKYIELLWTYLQQRYGDVVAYQKLSIIIRHCLHLQTIGHKAELKKQESQWQHFIASSE